MTSKKVEPKKATPEVALPEAMPMVQVPLNMVANVVAIIDAATAKGVFQGDGLTGVVQVREFFKSQLPRQQ